MSAPEQLCASGRTVLSAHGGSLVVCLVTPAAVYLGVDSRYTGAEPDLRDSAQKLIACGPTGLCGFSGLLRFTRTELDLGRGTPARQMTFELPEVAGEIAFDGTTDGEPRLAGRFVQRLDQTLTPLWARFAADLDEPFGPAGPPAKPGATSPRPLAQLFYVNREASGRVFLATIHLRHSLRPSNPGQYSSVLEAPVVRRTLFGAVAQPRLYLRGARRCVRPERLHGPVKADGEALQIIDRIFARAQHAIPCAAAIGGPIDVAVIDAAGRRWLRQKARKPASRDAASLAREAL